MTPTLRFYELSLLFNDDERLIAYIIAEHSDLQADKVYKHLLKGHFERYVPLLEDILDKITIHDLKEWKLDTLVKLDFSCKELFIKSDFQNLGD